MRWIGLEKKLIIIDKLRWWVLMLYAEKKNNLIQLEE